MLHGPSVKKFLIYKTAAEVSQGSERTKGLEEVQLRLRPRVIFSSWEGSNLSGNFIPRKASEKASW